MQSSVQNVRKTDWVIEDLTLPYIDGESEPEHRRIIKQLIESVFEVTTTFLAPRLVLYVHQPVVGRVANAVIRMCLHGIESCVVRTLVPGEPLLSADVRSSHIILRYADGRVVAQETVMTHDPHCSEEPLTHTVTVVFDKFHVETNEWVKLATAHSRAVLSLVKDTGSNIAERAAGC
jgi:hypothetical protein